MLNWIKSNKLAAGLLVIILLFFFNSFFKSIFGVNTLRTTLPRSGVANPTMDSMALEATGIGFGPGPEKVANVPADQRIVVQNSSLSLLVSDVQKTGSEILDYANRIGGFMVQSSYNQPEESPFATITIRMPSAKLDETLNYFRSLSLKVTNENIVGEDVTADYVDIQARMEALEKVKTKFEAILDSAVQVQDILTVQREIINTQTQIDSLRGQAQALEQNADLTKITLYLSTDELSLPYTPDEKFRPGVVFKLAVRSMLSSLQNLAELGIWVIVYAAIWLPAAVIFWLGHKLYLQRKTVKKVA